MQQADQVCCVSSFDENLNHEHRRRPHGLVIIKAETVISTVPEF